MLIFPMLFCHLKFETLNLETLKATPQMFAVCPCPLWTWHLESWHFPYYFVTSNLKNLSRSLLIIKYEMCSFKIRNVPFSNTKNVTISYTKKCPFQIEKSGIFKKQQCAIFKYEKCVFFSSTKMCSFQIRKCITFKYEKCIFFKYENESL